MSHQPTFVLTSKSKLKYNALMGNNPFELSTVAGTDTETPQPFGIDNTFICAIKRMENVNEYNYVISIENGAFQNKYKILQDICAVVIKDCVNNTYYDNKDEILKTAIVIPFCTNHDKITTNNGLGLTKTFGNILAKKYNVPHNDWMNYLCNFPRERQIKIAFSSILRKIENNIIFPKYIA